VQLTNDDMSLKSKAASLTSSIYNYVTSWPTEIQPRAEPQTGTRLERQIPDALDRKPRFGRDAWTW